MTSRAVKRWFGAVLLALLAAGCQDDPQQIRVLTDRTASHLQTIFDEYTKQTGVRIVANFVDEGLLARLESRPGEADLVVTKNGYLLESARRKGLLKPYISSLVDANVPEQLRDPDRHYTMLSYRARVIYYSKDRVKPQDLSTYLDLAEPKWKGRICLRSGFHDYNVSLFAQLSAAYGWPRTKAFLRGLRDNLARPPEGDDRAQVRGILEKKCDLALVNSYYMGIMLGREDQRAWALSSKIFFPDQQGKGALVMRSGAALTKAGQHTAEATKLLEFLTDDYAQRYFAEALLTYPVKEGVPMAQINRTLGAEQGIKDGVFKQNLVPLAAVAELRAEVIAELTELKFDRLGK